MGVQALLFDDADARPASNVLVDTDTLDALDTLFGPGAYSIVGRRDLQPGQDFYVRVPNYPWFAATFRASPERGSRAQVARALAARVRTREDALRRCRAVLDTLAPQLRAAAVRTLYAEQLADD